MYYTVIKHDGHLRCTKHEPLASVRSTFLKCSILNVWLRFPYLLYDIEVMWRKTIKQTSPMLYSLIKPWVFKQSERMQGLIDIIINYKSE